jgi:WD40 repeat protein
MIFIFKGAIFGITYHRDLLCTVGDDRTVKLYRFHSCLELITSFFAHEARIWQASLTSTHILTCGEDSSVRLWSQDMSGHILRCFSVHRCKSAWTMDILRDENDDKPLIIVSGWSDGAVRRHHLDDVPVDLHEPIILPSNVVNDFPRNVAFIDALTILIHMHSGQLLRVDGFQDQPIISMFYDARHHLRNGFAKLAVTNGNEKSIAIGSLDSWILIFDQTGLKQHEFQIDSNGNNKLLQILWLNEKSSLKLLVCLPDGIMVSSMILSHRKKKTSCSKNMKI